MSFLSFGNRKLPPNIAIYNITSATNCPAKKLGFCNHPNACYALKAERLYPHNLPYKQSQTQLFDLLSAEQLGKLFLLEMGRKKTKVEYFRFSESGDVRSQVDIKKLAGLAKVLTGNGIKVYGYTARKDLDFTDLKKYATINGQHFMVSNKVMVVSEFSNKGEIQCPGKCFDCNACATAQGQTIEIRKH